MTAAPAGGVRPALPELLALETAVVRPPVPPRGRGAAPQPGLFPWRKAGTGLEPLDSRPYVPGDEARHVDWRVSARAGQLYSKRFQAERARPCLLLLDPDPRQFFGTRVRFKSVQAARAAAAAAWWALRRGDRLLLDDLASGTRLRPPGGRPGVLRLLHAICRAYAAAPAEEARASLAGALEPALRLARGGTVVVLAEPERAAGVPPALWALLGQHLDLHLVLVEDRLETDPPPLRLAVATPAGRQWLDLADPAVRARWQGPRQAALARLGAHPVPGMRVHRLPAEGSATAWLPALPAGVAG